MYILIYTTGFHSVSGVAGPPCQTPPLTDQEENVEEVLLLCDEVDALRREVQRLLCSTQTFGTNDKQRRRAAAVYAPEVLDDML
jgi:hypothetical protein